MPPKITRKYINLSVDELTIGNGAFTMPIVDGSTGQSLVTDGLGNVSWQASSGSGTVTSITAGSGLNGGTITGSGTIDLANTAVQAGSYTNANITVDSQGRITLASDGTIGSPAGNDEYIQFNNNGAFGAGGFLTTNKTSKVDITYELGLKGDGTNHGLLKLYCEAANAAHHVAIKGPDHTGGTPNSYTIQLPNSLPNSTNQILESDATGKLTWINTPSGGQSLALDGVLGLGNISNNEIILTNSSIPVTQETGYSVDGISSNKSLSINTNGQNNGISINANDGSIGIGTSGSNNDLTLSPNGRLNIGTGSVWSTQNLYWNAQGSLTFDNYSYGAAGSDMLMWSKRNISLNTGNFGTTTAGGDFTAAAKGGRMGLYTYNGIDGSAGSLAPEPGESVNINSNAKDIIMTVRALGSIEFGKDLIGSVTTNFNGATDSTNIDNQIVGVTPGVTTNQSGVGLRLTVAISGGVATSILVSSGYQSAGGGNAKTAQGSGFKSGDIIKLEASTFGGTQDLQIELTSQDVEPAKIVMNSSLVGIGTNTPDRELHVKGSSSILKLETTEPLGKNFLEFHDTNGQKGYVGYGSTANDNLILSNKEAGSKIQMLTTDSLGNTDTGFVIDEDGIIELSNLAGTGTRMVVADATGILSTQTIGTGLTIGDSITGGTANTTLREDASNNLATGTIKDDGIRLAIGANVSSNKLFLISSDTEEIGVDIRKVAGGFSPENDYSVALDLHTDLSQGATNEGTYGIRNTVGLSGPINVNNVNVGLVNHITSNLTNNKSGAIGIFNSNNAVNSLQSKYLIRNTSGGAHNTGQTKVYGVSTIIGDTNVDTIMGSLIGVNGNATSNIGSRIFMSPGVQATSVLGNEIEIESTDGATLTTSKGQSIDIDTDATTNIGIDISVTGGTNNYALKLVDGTQQDNYVLTSDANGNASWESGAPYIGQMLSSPSSSADAKKVLFVGVMGELQGNTNFTWDNTNNRFGIGTSTPSSILDIEGGNGELEVRLDNEYTSNINQVLLTSTNGGYANMFSVGSDTLDAEFQFGIIGSTATALNQAGSVNDSFILASSAANDMNIINNTGSGTTDNIAFYVGKTVIDTLASTTPDLIILGSSANKGNIGVGTATPTEKLEVTGNVKVDGQITAAQGSMTVDATTNTTTFDCDTGNGQSLDLANATGDITLTFSEAKQGGTYFLKVIQKATSPVNIGTYTIAGGTVKWPGGTPPTISTGANEIDTIVFYYDGTDIYGNFAQNYS